MITHPEDVTGSGYEEHPTPEMADPKWDQWEGTPLWSDQVRVDSGFQSQCTGSGPDQPPVCKPGTRQLPLCAPRCAAASLLREPDTPGATIRDQCY